MANFTQWPGLFTNYDPHDIPPGGARVQENLMSISPGKLEVRRGYKWFATSYGQVKSLFRCYSVQQGESLFVHAGTYVYKRQSGTSTWLESGVSARSNFCQTRKGWVIRVNGGDRGTIYDGTTVWKLGMTEPVAAPTIVASYGSGDAYKDSVYYFAYRYRDAAGVCSNLSDLQEFTPTNPNAKFEWTVTLPTETAQTSATLRAQYIDLFRSLSDDPTVLYKVATLSNVTNTYTNDGASDELLLQAEPLPVYYGDGQKCARRFTPPPTDRTMAVQFQDRYWYAVQEDPTSDRTTRNLVYWSCPDEPESVPTENAIEISGDPTDPDDVTIIFTHSSALYVGKTRHIYRLSYGDDPRYSASCRLVAARGVLNPQCIDMHEGVAYFLDQMGPWRMTGNQADTDYDMPIRNLWTDGTIDYSKASTFFVAVDPNQAVVRHYVVLTTDSNARPKRALCYGIRTGAWWWESYPLEFAGRARFNISGRYRTLVGASTSVLIMGEGYTDALYNTSNNAENWYSTQINYSYQSGILEIPETKVNQPRIPKVYCSLTFEPTSGNKAAGAVETVNLLVYNDHDATANVWSMTDEMTTRGGTSVVVNMLRDQSPYSDNVGCTSVPIQRRVDGVAVTHRFVSLGLSGHQNGRPHIFYSLGLDGE